MEGCLGAESFQMWELNRRLEAYLARVKALEEQHELLSAELVGLRARAGDASWRARADGELAALRALVDQRWRERHAAEVARDGLAREAEGAAGRCRQQRRARERAAEELARSRRAAEAEEGARAWLSGRAAALERELEALRAEHEEERAGLAVPTAAAAGPPRPPRAAPAAPGPEVEELARLLGEAWRGAVRGYQERVERMEAALGEARQRLGHAVQGARRGHLELQQLQAERGGLQERRAALEQRLEGRWQEQLRAAEKFQLAVEALEQEKKDLQSQIAQVLEGRQQLARLKMSLSLEVATYRTLLEAENSRLQMPGGGSKASFSFQDPKLELHFPGTPEGQRLGPLLSVLSPTPLSLPLPDTLQTPVPAFLKSQEFLQARTPTLASTPLPPPAQAPCPVTDGEIRAQDAPLSVLQPEVGRQPSPQAMRAEANVAIPASILPGPEQPGRQQLKASTGQSPEDHASLAPLLSPDHHPSLEGKDGEPSETRASDQFQKEDEGELAEKEIAIEVKVVTSPQQQTQQEEGDLDRKEIQGSQGPLEKETLKSLEEEGQEPLMFLEKQSQETLTPLGKENQELLTSLAEKNREAVGTLEKETLELFKPVEKEDLPTSQSLEEENQELVRSLGDNLETFLYPGKGNQELVQSLEEEDFEFLSAPEKQNQEPPMSVEEQDQKTLRTPENENPESPGSLEENQESLSSLEKENQEPRRPLEGEDQETPMPLEKETQQPLESPGEEDQMTSRPLEEVKPEPLKSLGKDQGIVRPLEKENQELLRSLNEECVEAVRCLETENLEPLTSAGEDLETVKSAEIQGPLWSLEEMNHETMKPLQKEIQESLGSVEENQESVESLEKENQEPLRSLGEWDLENVRSLGEVDKESQKYLEEEENLEKGENQESLRSLEEEGQELLLSADQQRWEDTVMGGQELDQETPSGRAEADDEDEAELELRECDGKEGSAEEGEPQLPVEGGAWSTDEGHPGSPEPKEQRAPAEGTSGEGVAEGLQKPEGQPETAGAQGLHAPWGVSEVIEPGLENENKAPGGGRASPEVTLGLEAAMGESASGAEQGLEQKMVGLEDPGHLAREEVMEPVPGGESLEAKSVQGLEGPEKDLEEAAAPEPELPRKSSDSLESPGAGEELEPEVPSGEDEVLPAETLCHDASETPQPRLPGSEEAEEDAEPVLGSSSPRPAEPSSLTPIPEAAPGPQPLAEGNQEAGWGLEGRAEALGKVEGEKEQLGPGGLPEGLQDEEEESRDESEADELGETLPDSTPLALYLSSPAASQWELAAGQRPSPQGEARKEGCDFAVLTPEGHGAHSEEEEKEEEEEEKEEEEEEEGEERGDEEEGGGDEEEECGQDSDLSEEFEDNVGTEASVLHGDPGELMEPLGQVSQVPLEPAAWGQDGESDGFADEEESGEDGEEEEEEEQKEPAGGQWGPGPSVDSLPAMSSPQREDLLGSEAVDASIPWDDGWRGAAADPPLTAQETESPDSTEPSGSEEESEDAPSEGEDQVPGPLGTLSGTEEDTPAVNGQGPSLKDELEHVNGGLVNGVGQSEGAGQGKREALEGDPGEPLEEGEGEEEEGSALKAPWAGASLHLGPGQFLKFTQREGDGDSWSSGED